MAGQLHEEGVLHCVTVIVVMVVGCWIAEDGAGVTEGKLPIAVGDGIADVTVIG